MELPAIFPQELTAREWPARRAQLLALFQEHVYGRTPDMDGVTCRCRREEALALADGRQWEAYRLFFEKDGRGCDLRFTVSLPTAAARALPCVLVLDSFSHNAAVACAGAPGEDLAPRQLITDRGWALVRVFVDDVCLDDAALCRQGVLRMLPGQGASSWGAIGAWAWAASRVIDFLCADGRFDSRKIAVQGCSRSGKAALWCAAQDERAAAVISTVSGCAGAAVTRGKTGEHVREITGQFPHWLCPRYAGYADREDLLPVDQHMLLALCAPRPLYVSSAAEDAWADPAKEFEACVLAGQAYRLLGAQGLADEAFPHADMPLDGGGIAYHVRTGAHGCRLYDWQQYLPFLARHFGA